MQHIKEDLLRSYSATSFTYFVHKLFSQRKLRTRKFVSCLIKREREGKREREKERREIVKERQEKERENEKISIQKT